MARVLCISSQTVYGPVGNSAAVPALQAEGHEVMQIPTVILSNHPGHGKPAGQSTPAPLLEDMLNALHRIDAFAGLSAVMTGYFTSAAQVTAVAHQVTAWKAANKTLHILVDPVIGDHGALYVPLDVAKAIRDELMPLATITTPNVFELTWLTGVDGVADAVKRLNIAETIVTSIPFASDQLATRLFSLRGETQHIIQRHPKVPHGTGDYLAGCYLAQRLTKDPPASFKSAMERLQQAILQSGGSTTLSLHGP
jgi:pyridoxine kinase